MMKKLREIENNGFHFNKLILILDLANNNYKKKLK